MNFHKRLIKIIGLSVFLCYALTYFLAPAGVSCFTDNSSSVFPLAVSGMRIYGLGFLFSGINIFAAVRMMAYRKGYFSGLIKFLRSFALLLLFLTVLPRIFGLTGVWLAVPAAETLTILVSVWYLFFNYRLHNNILPLSGTTSIFSISSLLISKIPLIHRLVPA